VLHELCHVWDTRHRHLTIWGPGGREDRAERFSAAWTPVAVRELGL
jgi:hypothetical protein